MVVSFTEFSGKKSWMEGADGRAAPSQKTFRSISKQVRFLELGLKSSCKRSISSSET